MKILVLGAGAIGGYFGGRLAQNGADVAFLVRPARQQQLAQTGLQIRSQYGDFSGQVKTIVAEQIRQPWDIILLACKAYDLDAAIETIAPGVGSQTAVLPLLNGIAHMERLNEAFGRQQVMGGLAKIVVALNKQGTVQHLNDWNTITFGEQDGSLSERAQRLHGLFPTDSVNALAVSDIQQRMWEKAVHLSTVAGIASLMRGSVGEIAAAPGGTALLTEFLHKNAEISTKEGFPISEEFLDEYRNLFKNEESTYVPSLLRDIERGGRNEGEHILGYMLKTAQKHGLDTALHRLVYMHIRVYDRRLVTNRLP